MSKFTRNIKRDFEFDGDKITIVMSRMKNSDFHKLASDLSIDNSTGKPFMKASFANQTEFLNRAAEILPNRVESMEGLTDEDGVELTIDDIIDEQYFMPLISEIFAALAQSSVIGGVKKTKKSSSK